MSNPFKVGDKVVEKMWAGNSLHGIGVATVVALEGFHVVVDKPSTHPEFKGKARWHYTNLRAAIAGQDYPLPDRMDLDDSPLTDFNNGPLGYAPNTGHLPDGSGVQKHGAVPLYPVVIAMRDGKLGGKYDYGVLSPRNQEPLWLSNHDAAVQLAVIIKKDLT